LILNTGFEAVRTIVIDVENVTLIQEKKGLRQYVVQVIKKLKLSANGKKAVDDIRGNRKAEKSNQYTREKDTTKNVLSSNVKLTEKNA
jgi:hypothetical protein